MDLVEKIEKSGREIVCDNFFTSMELAEELKDKDLSLTGTMRKSRMELPKEFLPCKSRPVNSAMYAQYKFMTLTSIVPAKNKAVVFLSSNASLAAEPPLGQDKLVVNEHYNKYKAGVDLLDKITKEYSISKKNQTMANKSFYQSI